MTFEDWLPLADRIGEIWARRIRPDKRDDVRSAARIALWQLIQRKPDASRGEVCMRVRGGIQDELRKMDWLSRRARARGEELRVVSWPVGFDPPADCRAPDVDVDSLVAKLEPRGDHERNVSMLRARLRGHDLEAIASEHGVSAPRVLNVVTRLAERMSELLNA